MLHYLPAPVKFAISSTMVILNSAFWAILIIILAFFKMIIPVGSWQRLMSRGANRCMKGWIAVNRATMNVINRINWEVDETAELSEKEWYLLIANHQSWSDIVVLCHLYGHRIPAPKFFLKQQLLYIPLVGLACWGLDMPFMRRYSRQHLIKNPHLRGKDIETTRKACEKFRLIPTTIINFVEGTRFAEHKKPKSSSYNYLLPPKPAGIAFALGSMGDQFDKLLDITIAYPENRDNTFVDMLSGRLTKVVVHVDALPVDETLTGDYFNDKQYKRQFQLWLDQRWQLKDQRLAEYYS